jgi:hypothetical protein
VIEPGSASSAPHAAIAVPNAAATTSAASTVEKGAITSRVYPRPGDGNWLRIIASQARSVTSFRWASASRAEAVTL